MFDHGDLSQVTRGRVVEAARPAAAVQRVLARGAGRLRLAQRDQGTDERAGGDQGVGMVGAEDGPAAVEQLFGDGSGGVLPEQSPWACR